MINLLDASIKTTDYSTINFIGGGVALGILIALVTVVIKTLWGFLTKAVKDIIPTVNEAKRKIDDLHNFIKPLEGKFMAYSHHFSNIEKEIVEMQQLLKDSCEKTGEKNGFLLNKLETLLSEINKLRKEYK